MVKKTQSIEAKNPTFKAFSHRDWFLPYIYVWMHVCLCRRLHSLEDLAWKGCWSSETISSSSPLTYSSFFPLPCPPKPFYATCLRLYIYMSFMLHVPQNFYITNFFGIVASLWGLARYGHHIVATSLLFLDIWNCLFLF